ncbi:hypothetical protein Tco_0927993 [Tanacetum coccineum]
MDNDQERAELQSLMKVIPDEEEVAFDAIPLATKPPSIGRIVGIKRLLDDFRVTAAKLEQENAKKQKMGDDQERAELQSLMKVIPDEEEVAIDAIPLATKPPSIGRIVGIKRLLDDLRVTAAKLMLLVQKLLLSVLKVNTAGIKVTTAKRLQLLEEFMLTEKRSKTYQRKNKD